MTQRDLVAIAADVNAAHHACLESAETTLALARRCGALLLEAKQTVGHGAWGTWLAEHFDASPRTARVYMQIAKRQTSAISIAGALEEGAAEAEIARVTSLLEQARDCGARALEEFDRTPPSSIEECQRVGAIAGECERLAHRFAVGV